MKFLMLPLLLLVCNECHSQVFQVFYDSPVQTTTFATTIKTTRIVNRPFIPVTRKVTRTKTGYYDGTSQWTYSGDIASHLANGHGVSNTTRMTKDEMEAVHDSLHNKTRIVSRSRTTARSTQSSCPNGVCPSPRRSLFGRVFFN